MVWWTSTVKGVPLVPEQVPGTCTFWALEQSALAPSACQWRLCMYMQDDLGVAAGLSVTQHEIRALTWTAGSCPLGTSGSAAASDKGWWT